MPVLRRKPCRHFVASPTGSIIWTLRRTFEATKTYLSDAWQYGYSNKVRVGHLMDTYADKVHLVQFGTEDNPVQYAQRHVADLQDRLRERLSVNQDQRPED